MKYIDIKNNALRLMGITPETQTGEINDEIYSDYVVGMDMSILRAIDRMKSLGSIPTKTVKLPVVQKSDYYNFGLSELKVNGELKSIKNIQENVCLETPFVIFDNRIFAYLEKEITYFAEYVPSDFQVIDEKEIELPDELARIIPYYIKADLYEEEEPSLASLSRNLFESYLEEYRQGNDTTTRKIKKVYSI